MKKIIGILGILLLTIGVFGQSRGASMCGFLSQSNTLPRAYFFVENDVQYGIAYDTKLERTYLEYRESDKNDILERTLSLYRLDGEAWTKVSNPIKTDYWKMENGVESYDYHKDNCRYNIERGCDLNELASCTGIGYSSVESKGGVIIIRMLNFSGVVGVDGDYNYHYDTYRLTQQNDGTYISNEMYTPNIKMKAIE